MKMDPWIIRLDFFKEFRDEFHGGSFPTANIDITPDYLLVSFKRRFRLFHQIYHLLGLGAQKGAFLRKRNLFLSPYQ